MAGILPPVTGADIGATGNEWDDLYLSGDLIDADANAVNVADLADSIAHPKLGTGCLDALSYTDNGGGSITVASCEARLYSTADFSSSLKTYTIPSATLSLGDNVTSYVVAEYNGGTPRYRVTTDVAEITESSIIPIFTFYRNGTSLHSIDWDSLGLGLTNRLHQSLVKTQRYRRESGMTLATYGTRNFLVTAGAVWVGAVRVAVAEVLSGTDVTTLNYHSSGNWATSVITQLNNTQYDNGTNLATLTTGRYAVNWIYRGVESQKHMYVTLGTGDYTLAQAQEAQPQTPPQLISSHAVLVGKIIIQKNSDTAYSVQSAFDEQFSTGGVSNHADLTGLTTAGAHPATAISVDASGFNGNLAITDDTVQEVAQKLDDIKLDTILAPTDTTINNATVSAHGLLPKLGGGTTNYLRADGSWSTPAGTYSLPTASTSTLGGVKIDGTTITISDGVISAGGASPWTAITGVSRTDANTLAKTGIESVLPVGTHVRMYSGAARPTTLTDWKHGYVISVGTGSVDICGEEVPTGGASLFVEYSTNTAMTMRIEKVMIPGLWAYATGTGRLASQTFAAMPFDWPEKEARLIGAIGVRSLSDDSGATQPTMMFTAGGTDLLGSALSVSETAVTTGVIASGQAVSFGEAIDIDCESMGTNADSKDLQAWLLVARHV